MPQHSFARRHYPFMDLPEAERRRIALETGTRGIWLACPLCGISRKMTERPRFDLPDRDGHIVQERAGGGAIRGWFIDKDKSYTLSEIRKNSEYRDVVDQIRKRCHEILRALG